MQFVIWMKDILAIFRHIIDGVFSSELKINVAVSNCFASSVDRKDGPSTVIAWYSQKQLQIHGQSARN